MLEKAETLLLRAIEHLDERLLTDVAQMVLGAHEVVAGIDVAIGLHDGSMTALLGVGADARSLTHPIGERTIEDLDKDAAYIGSHPFVENGAEEIAPLGRRNG